MLAELTTYLKGMLAGGSRPLRGEASGALVVASGHARFQEMALQGNLYSLSTLAAGVTIAAANVFSASAAQPLVGIFNPLGSGYNAVVVRGRHVWNSGTTGAGGLVWGTAPIPAPVTAAGANGAVSALTNNVGGSRMKTFVNTALTGLTTGQIQLVSGGPSVGAIAANSNLSFIDDVDGEIVVPPGGICGLFAASAGTSPIVTASMTWEEVPV